MPAPDALVARYRRQLQIYRDRTAGILMAAWDAMPTHDRADIERFVKRTAPTLVGAKTATVALSAGFFALALGIRPVAVDPADIELAFAADAPFLAMWHALSLGRPFAEAFEAGRSVAESVGFDFVQSASRRTGDFVAEASGRVVRWRRVPGAHACAWCHQVAGGLYRTAESADFGHNRCDCVAVPA
jgi:hypothetical protein